MCNTLLHTFCLHTLHYLLITEFVRMFMSDALSAPQPQPEQTTKKGKGKKKAKAKNK